MKELENLKMNDEYIQQNDIVKRYLHNKLTPEETVEFEEYILDKPELLEQLELDMVLVDNLAKLSQVDLVKTAQPRNALFTRLSLAARSSGYAWSISGIMALVMLVTVVQDRSELNNVNVLSSDIIYLEVVRGAYSSDAIQINGGNNPQIYALEIGAKTNTNYDIKIDNLNTSQTVNIFTKSINQDGLLILEFSTGLPNGRYKVSARESLSEEYKKFFDIQIN